MKVMNLNKINTLALSFLMLLSFSAISQQDEQSSLYMFNPLQFNPAYAGSRGDLSVTGVVRSQWVGIKGAPKSQFISLNSPLKIKNMALGMHVCNDAIGSKNRTSFYGDYSYTLNFKHFRKLNLGVSGGAEQLTIDNTKLLVNDPTDVQFLGTYSQLKGNAGVGLYYYTDKFFAGLSVPRLFETSLKNNSIVLSNNFTKRHYFLTAGYVFPLNSVVDLKTSVLLKIVPNAPLTADINANFFFYKKLWIGALYRLNESAGINIAFQLKEKLMFGYSFDFVTNGLSRINNSGSHEIMLNYSLNRKKAFGSPRYF